MNKDKLTRAITESAIEQLLSRYKEDPSRSLRTAVDLATRLSKGRVQQSTFHAVTELLEDENSPYYQVVTRMFGQVNPYALKNFGFNIGYYGLSKGSSLIREHEEKLGVQIPWSLCFQVPEDGSCARYRSLIAQGKELGVRCYTFMVERAETDLTQLLRLVREEEDCAFILILPPLWHKDYAARFALCTNLFLLADIQSEQVEQEVALLKKSRLLFGLYYRHSTPQERALILEQELWARGARLGAPITICVSETADAPLHEAVLHARNHPQHATVPMNFFPDFMAIDRAFSEGPSFFFLNHDGAVHYFTEQGAQQREVSPEASLLEILQALGA